jgi:glycosyltransferase involved in cell wall biosynthesis
MKKIIKKIFRTFGIEITRYTQNPYERIITLKPKKRSQGNVLLSYKIEPILLKPDEPMPNAHTNYWESLQIAQTFLDFGYRVDVIDSRNEKFIPKKNYSFFITRTDIERIAQLLNKDCVKIVHLDVAHWLFNNYASYRRSLALQQRRGITVRSQRIVEPNLAIEYADYATILGNQFTIDTYSYVQKPIFRVPISTCAIYQWPENKNFEACRKNFLWFSGSGLVHKGLDLVLDAFAEMPDYHLYVCGPIQQEKDFGNAYHKELCETSNIHTIGWVDVESPEFIEITNNCIGLIHPSCAECGGGSVIACMHAGLIPIVSYESSVDVHDFGVILNDCSIDTIKKTVQMLSSLPAEELKQMARKAWKFARANHTRERFAEEYKKIITKIIEAQKYEKIN